MLKKILETHYKFANWEEECPRFKRLRYLDAWLDGKFYDPIPYAFCDEVGMGNQQLSIRDRRPSVQHNLPKMIANLSARKLFGGRHAPRLMHESQQFKKKVQALCEEMKLNSRMLEIVRRGSIGSLLVTFKFANIDGEIKSVIETFKSFMVTPHFDEFQELVGATIHYPARGQEFLDMGFTRDSIGKPIVSNASYWFLKDITSKKECIYIPIPYARWNPVNGDPKYVKESPDHIIENPLKFLPCVWIRNLPGGENPDGQCTFESSINNFIEWDYMYSQTGRGLYYGAAPQVVIKGELINYSEGDKGTIIKGPTHIMQLQADQKDAMGSTMSGSDAKLLETNGAGLKTALDYCSQLKHNSLEQDSVARKDLESIQGTMSGKAMELIDQEFLDLIQELRVQYCQHGYLPLLKRLCKAAAFMGHPLMAGVTDKIIDGLFLQYPADYVISPQDLLFAVQALDIAVNGSHPPSPPKPAGENTPAIPAPPPAEKLMDPEVARQWLAAQMDLCIDSEDQSTIVETIDQPVTEVNEKQVTPEADLDSIENDANDGGNLNSQYPHSKDGGHINVLDAPF